MPVIDRCPSCGAELKETVTNYSTQAIDPDTGEERDVVVRRLPVLSCASCKEVILDSAAVDRIDEERAMAFNLLRPEAIRSLRERFGLSQAELADFLGLGAKTVTRWETGRLAPSRAMSNYLRLVDVVSHDHKLFEHVFRNILHPALSPRAQAIAEKVSSEIKKRLRGATGVTA